MILHKTEPERLGSAEKCSVRYSFSAPCPYGRRCKMAASGKFPFKNGFLLFPEPLQIPFSRLAGNGKPPDEGG